MKRPVAQLLSLSVLGVSVALYFVLSNGDATANAPAAAPLDPTPSEQRDAVRYTSLPRGRASADPEPVDPEVVARPSCFSDVLAIDRADSLDGIRSALEQGYGGDPLVAEYLQARIAELIGKSAEGALAVLAWAKEASGEDAEILLAGLALSDGARDPRVAEGLLALGESGEHAEAVRLAAVDALRSQPSLDGDDRARLKQMALEGDTDELAWRATRSLGSVMNEDHKASGEFEPYWDELMDIARDSTDPAVRALALEAPAYSDPILPRSSIEQLTELMLNEPDRDVRELAAFQLGLTDSPEEALEAFRRAFEVEYDECVRWAIVRFAVRAAGEAALPLLAWFASQDPAFVADYEDFRALFAAGYSDFEQIWLNKPERHACVVEDGHIHGG